MLRAARLLVIVLPLAFLASGADPRPVPVPYPTAHEQDLNTIEELVKDADDHTQYRVEFAGVRGDRVPAYLYVPTRARDAKPAPAVLLQYGTGGNKNTNYIVAIGKQFVARGYVVLTIDSPGCGERRAKDRKSLGILELLATDKVMHYCGDYCRALDFLTTRPEVNKDRLGYVGISWGAITGITYVAHDPRIKAMGSLVGGGNFLGGYSEKAVEKAEREGKVISDPAFHVARIAPRPLLFLNVTKDQLILRSWAESLHKAAGPGAKVEWLETDHYFKGLDRLKVADRVIDFMDREMKAK